jgi:hypothetical protein
VSDTLAWLSPLGSLAAGFERLAQAQHFGAGLGDIHIDRIELVDGGERAGWLAVTNAPLVTAERPMRPEIGAVTLV